MHGAVHTVFWFFLIIKTSQQNIRLLSATQNLLKESHHQTLSQFEETIVQDEYDFIVVGAGTAGCTVATRLSENSKWKVLILEAGGAEAFFTDIPVIVGTLQLTEVDWQYEAESSSSSCLAYENHQCRIPRGKVLGGSSVLNYMIATRGNRKDYDNWEALGNPAWKFDEVLPYFLKAENITIDNLKGSKYHSTKGPLTIGHTSYHSILGKAFLEAGQELGHRVGDYNGESQTVFSYFQFTQDTRGRRASNSRRYLIPALKRENLTLKLNSTVTQIIIENSEVRGVSFMSKGRNYQVKARKEVILTAGAINSPQILMLSGIGPEKHLQEIGIPVVKNLQVGFNFQDHVSMAGITFTTNVTSPYLQPECIANRPEFMVDYVERGTGPWTIPGGNEGVFFYNIESPNDPYGHPEIELHFSTDSPYPEARVRGFRQEYYTRLFDPIQQYITWSMQPILMRPKSRGRIMLKSNNPFDKPIIMPNYFQNKDDIPLIIKGIRKIMDIAQTNAFKKFDSKLNRIPVPGCERFPFGQDEYWECALKHLTITNYHQSGSCKMGPSSDPEAVVDSRLKVHGMAKLRVIDASIMPLLVTAHTNIPTNMIAERGSDFVKEDHKE